MKLRKAEKISWDEFFQTFDDRKLALLHQEDGGREDEPLFQIRPPLNRLTRAERQAGRAANVAVAGTTDSTTANPGSLQSKTPPPLLRGSRVARWQASQPVTAVAVAAGPDYAAEGEPLPIAPR